MKTRFLLSIAVATATAVSARTVYDVGQAFLNAGHTVNSFGPWTLWHASGDDLASTSAFDPAPGASSDNAAFQGIGGDSSPTIRINTSEETQLSSGEEILPAEIVVHPGNPDSVSLPSCVIRFTAPEAGWYSALAFVHDLSKDGASHKNSGVLTTIRAAGSILVRQEVSLEGILAATGSGYAAHTQRFDFQMPARQLAVGEMVELVIGNKTGVASDSGEVAKHAYDLTGVRLVVTKEDDGSFYDSGRPMSNSGVASDNNNPFGTVALGMWYWLYANVPSGTAFASWSRDNLTKNLSRLGKFGIRTSGAKGFGKSAVTSSPYFAVNTSSAIDSDSVAPGELLTHPTASGDTAGREWPTLRFRPARSGFYSGSVVLRDTSYSSSKNNSDGVEAFLVIDGNVVTNAVIGLESFASTAHFSFDARLVAANEPIDIVVSPRSGLWSDATAISAIFRREEDVWDAGRSLATLDWAGGTPTHPFADALGGGMAWDAGWVPSTTGAYTTMPAAFSQDNEVNWRGFGNTGGTLPRIIVATNGIAGLDSRFVNGLVDGSTNRIYSAAPWEMWLHPNSPGSANGCPALRAVAPSDGVYHLRAYGRDLSRHGADGVRIVAVVGESVFDAAVISIDQNTSSFPREAALDGSALWMRNGDAVAVMIDPRNSNTSDGTGLGAAFAQEAAAASVPSVVNVDFAASGSGKFSAFIGRGREGYGDWTAWNALRPNSTPTPDIVIENCTEADRSTCRNVTVALTRSSGAAVLTGTGHSGNALCDTWIASSDSSDNYAFTISKLLKNEPYTLYFYSAKGTASGNAVFTVNGSTTSPDGAWFFSDATKVVARLSAVSDGTGRITGSFSSADANGAAFNGLSIVGFLPNYKSPAMLAIFR